MGNYILLSPAKINLWLKVVGKREDGYHLINSLVQKIALFDIIKITESEKQRVTFLNSNINPNHNTISEAVSKFLRTTGIKQKFYIKVKKNIPTEAGLGGGSSNAGVILSFLNCYFGNLLSFDEMIKLGCEVGADVPLFISSEKKILMQGIGEILSYPKIYTPNYWVLLVKPPFSVSTEFAYKKLNFKLTNNFKSINKPHPKHSDFVNDLEEAVIESHEEIKAIKEKLYQFGSKKSLMTGSGSVVYGLFENKNNALNAKSFYKNKFNSYKTFLTNFLA